MISKETFCLIINMIKEQDKVDEAFSTALETVCDSWCLYGTKNKKYDALFLLLNDIFQDKGSWISWWIYETDYGAKESVVIDNKKKIYLRTPEKLYDFLLKNMEKK